MFTKLQPYKIMLKYCSEAVLCTLLLYAASMFTAIECSTASRGLADDWKRFSTLTLRRLYAEHCRQILSSLETL